MAKREHLKTLKQGVVVWNQWRKEHIDIKPDLTRVDLGDGLCSSVGDMIFYRGSAGIDFGKDLNDNLIIRKRFGTSSPSPPVTEEWHVNADLSGCNFSGVDLGDADLSGADLSKAKFSNSRLVGADLSGADLSGADLSGADLSRADLSRAYLGGADLSGSIFWWTIIAKTDLSTTQGLTTIHHSGPSHIELFSVQLPQDGSSFHFLRGVGVPDAWIDHWRTEMMHPIQYHSLFISYSSKDEILAHRLHADLQASGVRCWFAPVDLKIGDKFRQRIDEAIHLQDKLLLLLSEHSIESLWVGNEVEAALEKEDRQRREVLFPVRLDDSVMQATQAWAAKLRRDTHIGDFTNWTNPQDYQIAFKRLLDDLKETNEQQSREMKQ